MKNTITINEMYRECFKDIPLNKEFTRKEIIKIIQDKFNVNEASILPSDVCYNSSNKGVEKDGRILNTKYFIKIKYGVYQYVGDNYQGDINSHEFGTM